VSRRDFPFADTKLVIVDRDLLDDLRTVAARRGLVPVEASAVNGG
jgi:hypothetical protein